MFDVRFAKGVEADVLNRLQQTDEACAQFHRQRLDFSIGGGDGLNRPFHGLNIAYSLC